MHYKLVFKKLNEQADVAGVGTAGNIWIVLNALDKIGPNDTFRIDMETFPTANNEKKSLFGTFNAWEYYFQQTQIHENETEIAFFNSNPRLQYDKHYRHDYHEFTSLRKKFFKHFSLNSWLSEEIDSFKIKNMQRKVTLGVQIRLTDMKKAHSVAPLKSYLRKIEMILSKYQDIDQIFVATDDHSVINELTKKFDIPIICQPHIYRATEKKRDLDPLDRLYAKRKNHRFLLGREVLVDIFLLASCQYVLKSEISAVSQLAVFFGSNINKTFFVKDRRILELKRLYLKFLWQVKIISTKLKELMLR